MSLIENTIYGKVNKVEQAVESKKKTIQEGDINKIKQKYGIIDETSNE